MSKHIITKHNINCAISKDVKQVNIIASCDAQIPYLPDNVLKMTIVMNKYNHTQFNIFPPNLKELTFNFIGKSMQIIPEYIPSTVTKVVIYGNYHHKLEGFWFPKAKIYIHYDRYRPSIQNGDNLYIFSHLEIDQCVVEKLNDKYIRVYNDNTFKYVWKVQNLGDQQDLIYHFSDDNRHQYVRR